VCYNGAEQVVVMNIAVTYPAPGLPPRRAFNVEDVRRMIEAGVIGEDERIELVEGEIVVMAAKSYAHEMIKNALIKAVIRAAQPSLEVGVETTIQFSQGILLEPDIVVMRSDQIVKSDAGFVSVEQGGCSLLVEVSVSSLSYDKGRKAALYARLGVREFWVIDANERRTFVHTGPADNGWSSIVERGPHEVLTTPALPGFALKLSEISL
jgi:Uma2 family endonuclease